MRAVRILVLLQILRVVYSGDLIKLLDDLAKHRRLLEMRRAGGPCKDESDCQLILRFFTLHRYRQCFSGGRYEDM